MTDKQRTKYLDDCVTKYLEGAVDETYWKYLRSCFELIFLTGERSGMKKDHESTMRIFKKKGGESND